MALLCREREEEIEEYEEARVRREDVAGRERDEEKTLSRESAP